MRINLNLKVKDLDIKQQVLLLNSLNALYGYLSSAFVVNKDGSIDTGASILEALKFSMGNQLFCCKIPTVHESEKMVKSQIKFVIIKNLKISPLKNYAEIVKILNDHNIILKVIGNPYDISALLLRYAKDNYITRRQYDLLDRAVDATHYVGNFQQDLFALIKKGYLYLDDNGERVLTEKWQTLRLCL